jgi:tRNA C32,U32 (ribose-2'-O)-methylase TrmJ
MGTTCKIYYDHLEHAYKIIFRYFHQDDKGRPVEENMDRLPTRLSLQEDEMNCLRSYFERVIDDENDQLEENAV